MPKTRAAFAALLVAVAASETQAQTRQLELKIDSFARIALGTRTAVRTYDDSVRRSVRALDTAYAGTPIVVAERAIIGPTRAVATIVVDSVASVVGAAMSRLASYTFRAHVEYRVSWRRPADTTRRLVISVMRPDGVQMRAWQSSVDSADIAATLRHAMTYAVFAASDPAFFAWAGNVIRDDTLKVSEWANQRLLLVSAWSAVARRCYDADIRACKTALLLSAGSDPILEWHDSTTRRRLVRRHGALARRLDARLGQNCLAGSDAACVAILRLFPGTTFREPTVSAVRSGFLRHAIDVGGPGAVERLLTTPGAPEVRLQAAAGLPIDSLIGRWQTRVRQTRAPSEDLTIGIAIMSVAWAAGMGALSVRSSRWR